MLKCASSQAFVVKNRFLTLQSCIFQVISALNLIIQISKISLSFVITILILQNSTSISNHESLSLGKTIYNWKTT
jgi:hypothetical protein